MELTQAQRILGVTSLDDAASIKTKYRRLMSTYHPDVLRSEDPEMIVKAQLINEAYRILKTSDPQSSFPDEFDNSLWPMTPCEELFAPRDIFLTHNLHGESFLTTVARGKFLWDPLEEDFSLFLKSINQLCTDLMNRKTETLSASPVYFSEEFRFHFHKKLFQALTEHFMDPLDCLRKLNPSSTSDSQGRSIFRFSAFLGTDRNDPAYPYLVQLRPGTSVFPQSLKDNRIYVQDPQGHSLGYLSLENDAFYFCLIPLLRAHQAQVKMTVQKLSSTSSGKSHAALSLLVRIREEITPPDISVSRNTICQLLREWEHSR